MGSPSFRNHVFCVIGEHRTTKERLIFGMVELTLYLRNEELTCLKTNTQTLLPVLTSISYAVVLDIFNASFYIPINIDFIQFSHVDSREQNLRG